MDAYELMYTTEDDNMYELMDLEYYRELYEDLGEELEDVYDLVG